MRKIGKGPAGVPKRQEGALGVESGILRASQNGRRERWVWNGWDFAGIPKRQEGALGMGRLGLPNGKRWNGYGGRKKKED